MRKTKRPVSAFAKKSCVTATQIGLAMMAAPMALAQQAEVQKGERIEITGTRIPSPNLESTSHIPVNTAQDIKFKGVTRIEDILNSLPQVFADFGANVSNGATGTATVNLRNLGATRTLVLMNGKRLPIGSALPFTGSYPPDLNSIPAPLIQRIEVLTGGASAVYGSDAVAGVVNFIMRDNFEGVQVDGNYSWYQHSQHSDMAAIVASRAATNPSQFRVPGDLSSGGESTETSLLMGGNFANGKGNATVFFDYKKDKPLQQSDYDYSACASGTSTAASRPNFTCGGSSTPAPGGRVLSLTTGGNVTITSAAGAVRNFSAGLDQFNFAPYNYYQVDAERHSAAAFAHYDINSHVRAYTEFSFMDNHTIAQIAPSGAFFGGIVFTLTNANPLLSSAFKTAMGITPTTGADIFIGRRNLEGGGRQADIRNTSYREVLGVKGDIMKNWDYDVYMQTSTVTFQQIYRNDFSNARIVRAVDVVTNPATGQPICRSALDGTDPACAPYNIFNLGGVTPAALAYVSTPGLQKGDTVQRIQGGTLSTDLGNYGWRFPVAKQGIGIAVGTERRVEKLTFEADTAFNSGDRSGQGGPINDLNGQFTVKDFFGEVRVPIRHTLSVNGSYRYSDYSTGKTTDSYGLRIELTPIKTVKLRGSYQQAVRAANIVELFAAQGLGLFNGTDPCASTSSSGATVAGCVRSGLTAAQVNTSILTSPAGQYNAIFGGNPDLNPETAKTYTAGIALTPMRNLSATLDYFTIKVEDVIGTAGANFELNQCVFSGQFCDLIHRDSRTGALWVGTGFVTATNINTGSLKTSGLDIAINYNHNLAKWGALAVAFNGTYLDKFITEPLPGLGSYDCVGYYGATCGTPIPKWRHKLRGIWTAPWNFDVAVTWRHMDKVKVDSSSSNALLAAGFDSVGSVLAERDYMDISASWDVW